ncbi:hypothetical protein [Paenibacillus sp. GCM10012306]|uniref:hypothetical protein n=1 Tax=Paenibacillus sp. GCM10012306 TaxID=3317342 RepID=UPI0036241728
MNKFENLSKDKETIMQKLATSQNLCKALKYSNDNFLDMPDIEDTSELFYEKLYPYPKVPSIEDTQNAFVTIEFKDYRKTSNPLFKSGLIYIHAFCHVDKIRTDHGLRYNLMISEIDKTLNNIRGLGFGKLEFNKMDEYYVNEKYMGMDVVYKVCEFN